MAVVILRALAVVGFQPFVFAARCCGLKGNSEGEVRSVVDGLLSMLFIEIPFLNLRWIAWRYYGVPVSVMGVKNILGIYEDLHRLGIVRGYGAENRKPRGLRFLCCRQ